jgi:hypothetical protein
VFSLAAVFGAMRANQRNQDKRIDYIDLYHRSGLNPLNVPTMTFDGWLHPNATGYADCVVPQVLAGIIAN